MKGDFGEGEEDEGEDTGEEWCRVSQTVMITVSSTASWSNRRGRRGNILFSGEVERSDTVALIAERLTPPAELLRELLFWC